jgi:coenzyme PQQ precursor peptide PqqA
MSLTPEKNAQDTQTLREPEVRVEQADPKPWTAPDFVERSTCAEIGAYAFQDR